MTVASAELEQYDEMTDRRTYSRGKCSRVSCCEPAVSSVQGGRQRFHLCRAHAAAHEERRRALTESEDG